MHVSRTHPSITGFTTRRTGANLPAELGPWALVGQGAMHVGDPVAGVYRGADTVLAGIGSDGFHIARVDTQVRHSA
jgi:hypothetical protein